MINQELTSDLEFLHICLHRPDTIKVRIQLIKTSISFKSIWSCLGCFRAEQDVHHQSEIKGSLYFDGSYWLIKLINWSLEWRNLKLVNWSLVWRNFKLIKRSLERRNIELINWYLEWWNFKLINWTLGWRNFKLINWS